MELFVSLPQSKTAGKDRLSYEEACIADTGTRNVLFCGPLGVACRYLSKKSDVYLIRLRKGGRQKMIDGLMHYDALEKVEPDFAQIVFPENKAMPGWTRRSVSKIDAEVYGRLGQKTGAHGIFFHGADAVEQDPAYRFKNFHSETILFPPMVPYIVEIVRQSDRICRVYDVVKELIEKIVRQNENDNAQAVTRPKKRRLEALRIQ